MEQGDITDWIQQSPADQPCGGKSVRVDLTGGKVKDFYLGSYEDPIVGKRDLKIVMFSNSEDNEKLCKLICILSRKSKISYILVPEIFAKTLEDANILMGYSFDKPYHDYEGLAFHATNSIMCTHWREQIKHLLDLFGHMQDREVYHGHLDDINSYVYRGDCLHILGPTQDGQNLDESMKTWLANEDIRCFQNFLSQNFQPGYASDDLDSFYDLCSYTRPVIKKIKCLRNHPLLKDSLERFTYFWHWFDCCIPKRNVDSQKKFRFESFFRKAMSVYMPWNSKLTGLYLDIYDHPEPFVGIYDGHKYWDFPRYIRNLLKHFRDKNFKSAGQLERDLEIMYPGLLSALHNCCAKLNCDYYSIASE